MGKDGMTQIPDSFMVVEGVKYRVYDDERSAQFESEPVLYRPDDEPISHVPPLGKWRIFSYGGGYSIVCQSHSGSSGAP